MLAGGFDEEGRFVYLPIADTKRMTEMFRRLVIKRFQEKKLITERFAWNLLSWKNSGFSVDNSIRIYGNDHKAREAGRPRLITIYSQTAGVLGKDTL